MDEWTEVHKFYSQTGWTVYVSPFNNAEVSFRVSLSLLNQEFSWSFLLFSDTYYPILYNYASLGQALNWEIYFPE